MEKGTAHYPLRRSRELLAARRVRFTHSARGGATAIGLDMAGMVDVIAALCPADFYKSMTTYADHTVWQDVYRPVTRHGGLYLKLTVTEDLLVVSFKAR
ncbi:type II toxin-antitoxin system MqsR family toxin [Cupriavidus alkaliphilus]|uniref:type II toxin-antitoxin system MqsR family toxin n=1 Tax=Cupriavidus alkaliphilus TaxID=942866 RepID=UPI00161F3B68|nr:type II toxin-antitoxin system MqsR family toxin [Cupriavidus alkaliphilus]MBB2921071.1 motility quorum-sensing regulator/GCU-specific mRNA interferase toxin [Cupriavidus alkaliphilus]